MFPGKVKNQEGLGTVSVPAGDPTAAFNATQNSTNNASIPLLTMNDVNAAAQELGATTDSLVAEFNNLTPYVATSGMSYTTLLIIGGGVVAVILLLKRK